MVYSEYTGSILDWLGYRTFIDFDLLEVSGNLTLSWHPQPGAPSVFDPVGGPTEQDILDQVVPWLKYTKQTALQTEYVRRIQLVNSHVGSGGLDGLAWAESMLKAARDLAELAANKAITNLLAANPTLIAPAAVNISGAEFLATIILQSEIDAINDLRTTYNAAVAVIDALTTAEELDAYDVVVSPNWP